jgi:hypothetical protein
MIDFRGVHYPKAVILHNLPKWVTGLSKNIWNMHWHNSLPRPVQRVYTESGRAVTMVFAKASALHPIYSITKV